MRHDVVMMLFPESEDGSSGAVETPLWSQTLWFTRTHSATARHGCEEMGDLDGAFHAVCRADLLPKNSSLEKKDLSLTGR